MLRLLSTKAKNVFGAQQPDDGGSAHPERIVSVLHDVFRSWDDNWLLRSRPIVVVPSAL